jgi:hypothetical protein
MKTAEEVARELAEDVDGTVEIEPIGRRIRLEARNYGPQTAELESIVAFLAELIERSRAEGAAAERERLAAHAGRPAEEVAAEMVYTTPGIDPWPTLVCLGDDEDYVPLEHQEERGDVDRIAGDARGILERLIARERAAAYAQGKADGAREQRVEIAASLEELSVEWPGAAGSAMAKAAKKIRSW